MGNIGKLSLIILLGSLIALMTGCASEPKASAPKVSRPIKEQAINVRPPPGQAGIYIIRTFSIVGAAVSWDISLDNQKFGSLKVNSYIYTSVFPGEHFLSMPTVGQESTPVMTEAGQNYFLTVKPGWSGAKFSLFSDAGGEVYVRKHKHSQISFYKLPFIPETVDSATPVACRVVLPQDDPFVAAKVIQMGAGVPVTGGAVPMYASPAVAGADFGAGIAVSVIMDLAIAEGHKIANKERADRAAKMTALLKGYGLGDSFRTNFESLLSGTLNSSPWLHTMPVEMTNRLVTVAEVNQHPAVQINLVYNLSYDASALIMQARLLYFRQGETNATYARYYTYYSGPVGPEQYEAAIAKWTASDEVLLHRRLTEGMNEILAMIDLDFCHRKPMDPTSRSVTISVYDALALNQESWKGFILRDENPRMIFQEQTGNFFSIIPGENPFTASLHTSIKQPKRP